ncbi:stereocilin [Dendrobates tinctorius]|uniref:stereocilin n=1 Tax=Dendrobates tinctorius TaxID=92724 RepID=UPI003CCA19D9
MAPEDVVWEVLEDLRYSLMKRMERSVYDNLNRKVSRMAGTLMHRVSSVIGIPHADQNGRCSVGNLQQLLLWGIKHNITWNTQSLGFTSTSFPSSPPILTCRYSLDTLYDLQVACSDAAWYLTSMEEDSFWVWVCREYFPIEFNITVCKNTTFPIHNQESPLMVDLCTNVYNSSEATREKRKNIRCSDVWQGISMNPKALKTCLFENKTIMMEKLCSNDSLSGMLEDSKAWVSGLCNRHMVKSNMINITTCNYKAWDSNNFSNVTLVEECKGINIQDFMDLVCRNATLYFSLKPLHPWIVDQCWKNISLDGKCFLQRLADVLPVSSSFDSSQLCKNPISYILGLVSQLSQCDSESYGWASNVQYLLKVLDFLFSLSDSDWIGKEARDRLGEAILLSSLLDNSSFWTSFKMNSSMSILQTVELYLENENSVSDKEDLLSCFSPVLWDLIQKEENATALEILLQEYLQMPREGFQKVLLSAENDAVQRFISLMHRSWPRIQMTHPDERDLETLTSMVIQKFTLLTPQIFVDLSQFIPFMSISDILNFPITLLVNQSVLDAIKIHSQVMKVPQKRAFAKHFLQADMFGDVPSWPPHFLRSIQPLLPYLPFCHFVQLSADQIKLLADGWKDVNLGMIQGRYVAQSLMNTSQDIDKVQSSLGTLANGIECDNLQQLNTLSEIRDVVKYLQGIPSGLRKNLRKCILEEIQKRPELSWEDTSWMGPEFITDLPIKLIDRLSNESVKQLLEHAHKYPKSFMELPLHKKSTLAQRALHILHSPTSGEITAQDLDLLGPLVGFIGEEDISRINRKHLLFHLEELKSYCLSEEFSGKLGWILTEDDLLGNPTHWTHTHIQLLGRLIFYLTPENIHFLRKDVLGRDILEWLLESQREWEDSDIGKICTTQNSVAQERTRRNKVFLASFLTKSGFRGIRDPIPKCVDMRVTFPSAWSPSQISGMSLSEFEGCLTIITQDLSFAADQAKAALGKAKQVFGPVKSMSSAQFLQLGHLITFMTEKDLNEMNNSDWGVVSLLGKMENWTWKQMRTLTFSVLRQNKKSSSDLDLMELTALGHLLCGLGVEELKKINPQEFSQAAVFVGTLKLKCTEAQMETLAELLTYNSAFGLVSRWGPEIFTEIGTLAAGLPDIILSSLIRDQIQGLTPDAISLISAPKFAVVFSPAQLSCFTSDQAIAVTPDQYDHLSYQQKQVISSAQYDGDIPQDLQGTVLLNRYCTLYVKPFLNSWYYEEGFDFLLGDAREHNFLRGFGFFNVA